MPSEPTINRPESDDEMNPNLTAAMIAIFTFTLAMMGYAFANGMAS